VAAWPSVLRMASGWRRRLYTRSAMRWWIRRITYNPVCLVTHIVGFVGAAIAGATAGASLMNELIAVDVVPDAQALKVIIMVNAAMTTGIGGGIVLAGTVGCYDRD
jgi:hypothetical protein